MTGPAQRAAARQAARRGGSARPSSPTSPSSSSSTARSSGTRRSGSAGRAGAAVTGRVASAAAAVRERPSLTGRAVVLAAVLALLVFTLAVPLRELFRQRADITALSAANAASQQRVDSLVLRDERLQDPAYVTSLVRERLHYVLPGEVGYVVLDPSEAPAPTTTTGGPAAPAWYATLWSAIETTDRAGAPAGPTRIPVRPNAPR